MKQAITNSKSVKLLKVLLGIAVVLLLVHIILQYFNWIVFYQQVGRAYELANRFDLDDEASVGTWFSQLLFLLMAVIAFITSYLEKKRPTKRMFIVLGAGALAFSVDEVAGLHEFILQSIHNELFRDQAPTQFANAWFVVMPLILAIAIWLIYKISKLFDKETVMLFGTAIFIFLLGAVGVDQITSITPRETFLHQGILVALEESLELVAQVVIVYSLARLLEMRHGKTIKNALKQLKQN